MKKKHATREQWLGALVIKLRPHFKKAGYTIPKKLRVSCGFPAGSRSAIGQAWSPKQSADKHAEVFISPSAADPKRAAGILVHELVHVTVGIDAGHGPKFRKCALAVGLEGKMRSTTPSDVLAKTLKKMAAALGRYPHATLTRDPKKKQGTRMIKLECSECGYVVRTTQIWIEVGMPYCASPCETEMAVA